MNRVLPQPELGKMIGTVAIIALSLTGVIGLQKSKINPNQETLTVEEYQKQAQLEKLQLNVSKGVPSLGFNNLLADWFYLGFIQYFGNGEARKHIGYPLSADFFKLVVDNDPRFVDAHLKLAVSTSIFAGYPEKSVEYLTKSIESLPEDPSDMISPVYPPYYLWIYKSIDELLFLGDVEAAKHSNTMAANVADNYPDEVSQAVAKRRRETVEFLEKNPKSRAVQIGAWSQILYSAPNEETVNRALAEIQALGGEFFLLPNGELRVRVPEWID